MTRRWLIDLPTRIHLWSAEFQIRHRSSSSDPARLRNLDVLREYRKSRAFPRNDTGLRSTPYFVDADGRHCAVGHLMRESGEHNAVRRIAATANLARIGDMNPADLAWADRSGLTKRELARIQPQYSSSGQAAVDLLLWTALMLVPFALLSGLLGRIGLRRTGLRQGLVGATVLLCTLWSVLGYMTVWMGGIHSGDGLTLIWFGWAVVIAGPILATVVMLRLVSRDRVREAAVAPITGAAVGVLMTIVTGAYLIVGAVDLAGREPEEPVGDGGLPLPYGGAVSGVDVSFPIGFGALLLGLLALGIGVVGLRRLNDPVH
ncbi:hypothetical protein [Kribbella sindirgiensis]|uniref:Uncharacterized protein n=1 Tax=Kribbella sindirgiensis TaxID=1124744 RepID=A0A4R0HZV0_9ACTN|nr:hypothetical protein [Kribbella sindirgiensis]TCC17219.1 hypothetical protein E0H50_39470 [Kribbella sindirgiensis]